MEVVVEGVSYLVQKENDILHNPWSVFEPQERVLLLNNVNLYLKSGSISCFIGTGEGQKRLLELIALKQTKGFMSGNILHDNLVRPYGNYEDISYVTRDSNTYYEGLTVFDFLYFGARLRLALNQVECREKIREVIKLVALDGGLKIHRLRKGEMVMLAVALELVTSPTLLILGKWVQRMLPLLSNEAHYRLYTYVCVLLYCSDTLARRQPGAGSGVWRGPGGGARA